MKISKNISWLIVIFIVISLGIYLTLSQDEGGEVVIRGIQNGATSVTYNIPAQYVDVINVALIHKKIDSKPEEFSSETIGSGILGLKEYMVGNRKVSQYSFVTATNYNWDIFEVEVSDSAHLEFGYTAKGPDGVRISMDTWFQIIKSIEVL